MASRRSSLFVLIALVAWAIFGSWALFRPNGDGSGINPLIGHVVVFYFVALAAFGLAIRTFGVKTSLAVGGVVIVALSGVSEALQPIVTETRQAQVSDFAANLVGIAGALATSVLLAAVLRKPAWREVVTALLCVVGLAGSVSLLIIGADRVRVELECRGQGLDPIDVVAGEPIIHVVGQTATVGNGNVGQLDNGIVADDSADLRCSVMRSGAYSIVATVVPATTEVGGPMRIFTSSISTRFNEENTHLGQEFDMLSVRVGYGGQLQWESVPEVFVAGERVTVAMVVGDGEVNVFVDGEWRAAFDLESNSFSTWDEAYPMLVGDEFTRDRTFEGGIESVSVFDRQLLASEAALLTSGN